MPQRRRRSLMAMRGAFHVFWDSPQAFLAVSVGFRRCFRQA